MYDPELAKQGIDKIAALLNRMFGASPVQGKVENLQNKIKGVRDGLNRNTQELDEMTDFVRRGRKFDRDAESARRTMPSVVPPQMEMPKASPRPSVREKQKGEIETSLPPSILGAKRLSPEEFQQRLSMIGEVVRNLMLGEPTGVPAIDRFKEAMGMASMGTMNPATLIGPAKGAVHAANPRLSRALDRSRNMYYADWDPKLRDINSAGITGPFQGQLPGKETSFGMYFEPTLTRPEVTPSQASVFAHEPIHAAYFGKGTVPEGLPPDRYIMKIAKHFMQKLSPAEATEARNFIESYTSGGLPVKEAVGEWVVDQMARNAIAAHDRRVLGKDREAIGRRPMQRPLPNAQVERQERPNLLAEYQKMLRTAVERPRHSITINPEQIELR